MSIFGYNNQATYHCINLSPRKEYTMVFHYYLCLYTLLTSTRLISLLSILARFYTSAWETTSAWGDTTRATHFLSRLFFNRRTDHILSLPTKLLTPKEDTMSWMDTITDGMKDIGIIINNVVHKGIPVMPEGTKTTLRRPCPKCGTGNAYVFISLVDKKVFFLFCLRCKKYSVDYAKRKPANPIGAAYQGMVQGVKALSCGCGAPLPKGRRKFCHTCRPLSNKVPKEADSQVVY